jgi:hypothetical protein
MIDMVRVFVFLVHRIYLAGRQKSELWEIDHAWISSARHFSPVYLTSIGSGR